MITRDLEGFISRDWEAVRRVKDRYWAERIARLGPAEGFRIADELRRQMLAVNPGWPDAAERSEDRAAHERLAEVLGRADATGRG
ncbi:MAG TPA: hypothetical protein VM534_01640 [Thermoanaerobaculia bacterium]|nr:hypothetical protein [Thermoanaerobaculia bacterium]